MSKVKTSNGYKDIDEVYSGSTYITEIYDKNGNKLYTADREIQGDPPLTFKSRGKNLKNYRIYGNTVNGESIGDRTENLFDISTIVEGKYINSSGVEEAAKTQYQENVLNRTDFINISNNTVYSLTCTMPYGIALDSLIAFCWFDSNKTLISRNTKSIKFDSIDTYSFSATSPSNAVYLIVNFIGYVDGTTYMLNTGSEPLPYEPYGYRVPVTVTNGTDTETTNLYLPEQIKMVGDEAEYVDYKEQKQHRVRKNLLPNPATSQTINGVTFTVNSDGSVTCNGTATAIAFFSWMGAGILPNNKLVYLTGCPSGGGASNYLLKMQIVGSPDALITDTGHGSITLFSQPTYPVLRIQAGYTCNNLTFYPMLRLASIADKTYEPYIADTELDVTLPALPTLSGTNTLSVGTEVQPSEVYVEGTIRAVS